MKTDILTAFGKRIRQLRTTHNLSQEQLAERTGFHRNYIGMIERGERNPALLNIYVFAQAFNISISELFNINHIDSYNETDRRF